MLLKLQGILVALVILFATLFANFWLIVAAYPSNLKSNSSGNLNSSEATTGRLSGVYG
jgi:hypothetical protein